MSEPKFAVSIDPGRLHFNAAHFITFNNTCENLHGHNFHARIEAFGKNNQDGYVLDFVQVTELAAKICASLNDKVLLPGQSNVVSVKREDDRIHVESYGQRFTLPLGNCAVLPVNNTTAEQLAGYICEQLLNDLQADGGLAGVTTLKVAVEEADRQWGICQREVGDVR
ncbi:MAG: 6-carboxytetrahydropterin synthase [Gammaproteobacteria bacterium]|jgi:6-pyruvoyltetrahydropterin/6-carboxytetrahydropterin synthase